LKAAERTRDFDDKAWAMRRTFDSVLEELKQRAKTLNRLLLVGKSVSAQPLIRAVVTGSVSTVAARLAAGDDIDWCARCATCVRESTVREREERAL
jgi:hypothetical protein